MTMSKIAYDFFDACETGKGAEACAAWMHDDATFSCQAAALKDVTTLAHYCNWMKSLLGPIPDGHYELKAFAVDHERGQVIAAAVFHGTHTGDGGPVAATGKAVSTDYAYIMRFDGDKIRHMTKIWNDAHAMRQAGWT